MALQVWKPLLLNFPLTWHAMKIKYLTFKSCHIHSHVKYLATMIVLTLAYVHTHTYSRAKKKAHRFLDFKPAQVYHEIDCTLGMTLSVILNSTKIWSCTLENSKMHCRHLRCIKPIWMLYWAAMSLSAEMSVYTPLLRRSFT